MKKYGIMAALFGAGLLLTGIGGGVAFAEYNSFSYGGEKKVEMGETEVVRIEENRETGRPFVIQSYTETEIIEDGNMEDHKLIFEIEYNGQYTEPHIGVYEAGENQEFYMWQEGKNEIGLMWKVKDQLISDIKERKIYDYDVESPIKKVTVYMSPGAKCDMIG